MKKFSVLLALLVLLTACRDEEKESKATQEDQVIEETEVNNNERAEEETEEDVEEATVSTLIGENVDEVIEYNGTGEGDELINAVIEDKEVKAEIKLAPSDLLPNDQLAITRYSQVSDELLSYEGWETLTVEYLEIGTISMNRSEAVRDEPGMSYFPSEGIMEKLK